MNRIPKFRKKIPKFRKKIPKSRKKIPKVRKKIPKVRKKIPRDRKKILKFRFLGSVVNLIQKCRKFCSVRALRLLLWFGKKISKTRISCSVINSIPKLVNFVPFTVKSNSKCCELIAGEREMISD